MSKSDILFILAIDAIWIAVIALTITGYWRAVETIFMVFGGLSLGVVTFWSAQYIIETVKK